MHRKLARLTAALCAATMLLASCGTAQGGAEQAEQVRLMVWSPSEDQSKDSGQWLQTCCERFAQMHPLPLSTAWRMRRGRPERCPRTRRPAPTSFSTPTII